MCVCAWCVSVYVFGVCVCDCVCVIMCPSNDSYMTMGVERISKLSCSQYTSENGHY